MSSENILEVAVSEDFWLKRLRNKGNAAIYQPDRKKVGASEHFIEKHIQPDLALLLNKVTTNRDSLFIALLSAFKILLYRYSGFDSIVVYGNNGQSQGLFYTDEFTPDFTFQQCLTSLVEEYKEVKPYENYRLNIISNKLEAFDANIDEFREFGFSLLESDRHLPKKNSGGLSLCVCSKEGGYLISIRYEEKKYDEWFIEQFSRHYTSVLDQCLQYPDNQIKSIPILDSVEYEELIEMGTGPEMLHDSNRCFLSYFLQSVNNSPDKIALEFEEDKLTYRALDGLANNIAATLLRNKAVQQNDRIAIMMDRSSYMVASIIAIWKLRAAYIPIEKDLPENRIHSILEDANPIFLIVENNEDITLSLEGTNTTTEVIYLNNLVEGPISLDFLVPESIDLAYIIYTSGSTGRPKGVMVNQLGMLNHMLAKVETLNMNESTGVAQTASYSFDISVWQFFCPLLVSGTVKIFSDFDVMNASNFLLDISKSKINILEVVPSYLSLLLDSGYQDLADLQYLLVTGETVKPSLLKKWFDKYPKIPVINAYGPTEASDDVTHHIITADDNEQLRISIGKPIRNTFIYIVDKYLNPCPKGVIGEIVVGGVGIGDGYLNRKELTEQKFIANNFKENPYPTLYKTGDLGSFNQEGLINFYGRKDYQIKIRGFRVELEEIESCISNIESIRDVAISFNESDQTLTGYLIFNESNDPDLSLLNKQLIGKLPDYMIPQQWVVLDEFPRTVSGKVDRNRLPDPDFTTRERKIDPPNTPYEKQIKKFWEEVLKIEPIGIYESFFDLGGDSIKGIRIINKIQEWIKEVVHVTVLFTAPTIHGLAKILEGYGNIVEEEITEEKIIQLKNSIIPLKPFEFLQTKNPPAIFILSPPRSGSTLLRVILAGHSGLFAPQETELLSFNTMGERRSFLDGKFSFYLEGVIRAVMDLKNCDADQAKEIVEEYEENNTSIKEFYGVIQQWIGNRMMVEKTPAYALDINILERIESYFENSYFIHLIRHPFAVIHSFMEAKLDQLFKFPHSFSRRELAEMVWFISHSNILQFLEEIPADRVIRVKYEDLVRDPDTQVHRITEMLQLEYEPNMLNVYDNLDNKMISGIYKESKMLGDVKFFKHQSIDTNSIENWKNSGHKFKLFHEVKDLAKSFNYLIGQEPNETRIKKVSEVDDYPCSHHQKRLWITQQIAQNQSAYNVLSSFILNGKVDIDALNFAYQSLIRRHYVLRTTFFLNESQELRQRIEDFDTKKHSIIHIEYAKKDKDNTAVDEIIRTESRYSFNLESGPLVKCSLVKFRNNNYVLIWNMHHIITDAWSKRLIMDEFVKMYNQTFANNFKIPEPDAIQYRDFAFFQNERIKSNLNKLEDYWSHRLADLNDPLTLPTDYKRSSENIGKAQKFSLDKDSSQLLNQLCSENQTSLFVGLLACYSVLTHVLSGQEKFVIGTSLAGRTYPELEKMIGFFINTVAIPVSISDQIPFSRFLQLLAKNLMEDIAHQEMPFDLLVQKFWNKKRIPNVHPIFQIRLVYNDFRNMDSGIPQFEGFDTLPIIQNTHESKFDMSLMMGPGHNLIMGSLEFNEKLWNESTILTILDKFKYLIGHITKNPELTIKECKELMQKFEPCQLENNIDKIPDKKNDLFINHFNA